MLLGYPVPVLTYLTLWALASIACLAAYRVVKQKVFLVLPPALSLVVSGHELYEYTKVVDSADVGFVFLFVLSLLHLLFAMLIDQRATDYRTKFASVAGLLIAGFAYFTDDLWAFGFLWILSTIPSYLNFDKEENAHPRMVFVLHHVLSFVLYLGGVFLIQRVRPGFNQMELVGELPPGPEITLAGLLLVGASLIRQAMFPFHLWFKAAYKTKPFPLAIGFYAMNLGFLLFYRLGLPIFSLESAHLFPYAMTCGVLSALYFANMSLVQTRLRSCIFQVMLAQYSTLYCGLESRMHYGMAGVIFQFITIGLAFTALIACLYAIEWNVGELRSRRFHGLQDKNPVLAVLFLLFALCAVALPFSMGFAGEDLIFHAVVEQYPLVGLGLIVAAAINGITLLKTTMFIFRGKREDPLNATIGFNFWQKSTLAAILFVLFLFGLAPSVLLGKVLQAL